MLLLPTSFGTSLLEDAPHQDFPCFINGQDIHHGKTVFLICHRFSGLESRRTAEELYRDAALFRQFSAVDLMNIVSTAVQEQTMQDLEVVYG